MKKKKYKKYPSYKTSNIKKDYKICLLGDTCVGKTQFLNKIITGELLTLVCA